ncbi:MAG TPA: hypothetical protein VLE97_00115 [Gaiellaceae bacterium]|nr:hypothetical protein [Gaiellaceae bacterium]
MSIGSTARPSFPRKSSSGMCPQCGDRLVRTVEFGRTSVLHETNGALRCPPMQRVCTLCERDGLMQCSQPGCSVVAHPGSCLLSCVCCASWGCPAHVSPLDYLCTSCASHGPVPDHEVPT